MADSIVLDGYTLNQNYHGSLTCLGVGSFGFALQATKNGEDAAVKLGHCARPDQLESARNEEIISQRLPEHQHVVRLRSFSAHDANSGPFLQSGALMSEVRAIAQQKAEIGHPFPNWMRDTQGVIRTPAIGRYCVLAFDLGGTQDLFGWYENYAHAGDTPPDTELRTVAKQMASALAHLHDHNIKHYDFKAENITVTIGSAGIITKLIDFGLARYDNIHPGLPGETGGTPMCAAPEMWAQRDAAAEQYNGPAADVWSYGGMSLAPSSPTCHLAPKHLAPHPRQCCCTRTASASCPSAWRTARAVLSSGDLSLKARRGGTGMSAH